MQIRGHLPQTLDDEVQLAEDASGVYGKGVKVTDWRVSKKRYREDGTTEGNADDAPSSQTKSICYGSDRPERLEETGPGRTGTE